MPTRRWLDLILHMPIGGALMLANILTLDQVTAYCKAALVCIMVSDTIKSHMFETGTKGGHVTSIGMVSRLINQQLPPATRIKRQSPSISDQRRPLIKATVYFWCHLKRPTIETFKLRRHIHSSTQEWLRSRYGNDQQRLEYLWYSSRMCNSLPSICSTFIN